MKQKKIAIYLALQEYRKWAENDLPKYALENRVTGTRYWYWTLDDLNNNETYYGNKFYEKVKIKWI